LWTVSDNQKRTSMIPGLSIAMEQNGDKRILRLQGCVDAQTLSSLQQVLDLLFDKLHTKVLLDFNGIEEVSSESLQLLFSETKRFREAGGLLGMNNLSDALRKKVKTEGFEPLFLIFRDEKEALEAMG
jgi:anti-anti-sigma factor